MSQRRLALDDEDDEPAPRGRVRWPELEDLMDEMEAILQFRNVHGRWHARRKGGADYGHGATAREAMERAMDVPLEKWRNK